MKICKVCHIEKQLTDFRKVKINKDGYCGYCKACEKEKKKKYYLKNKENIMEEVKKYYRNNKDSIKKTQTIYINNNKEKISLAQSKSYLKSKKERLLGQKRWYENNKEKQKNNAKEYRKNNKESIAINDEKRKPHRKAMRQTEEGRAKNSSSCMKYKAIKLGTSVNNTKEENYLIECVYAFSSFKQLTTGIPQHVDHIMPLSKGGLHHPSNLQILTAIANMSKGAKII